MKTFRIAVLGGDGIGPEVMAEAVKVLRSVENRLDGLRFELREFPCGAGEYLCHGDPLPADTMTACETSDAILLGAMGLPAVRWPDGTEMAPQLDLREKLDLYCGKRPIYLYHEAHTPLKNFAAGQIDLLIIRENTEGLFHSRKWKHPADANEVADSLLITRHGAERICRAAFREAVRRRGLVTLVDKANVLPSMAFFRRVFDQVAAEFPEVRTERIYIDAASLYLVQQPQRFDVMVTENIFGDILSDLAAGLVGGMGMAPSADIGDLRAVFQPSHGSAPDIAGKGIANPVATILSLAMMLEWLGHAESIRGGAMIRQAVARVCGDVRFRTKDLGGSLSTVEMGDRVVSSIL